MVRQKSRISQRADFWLSECVGQGSGEPEHLALGRPVEGDGIGADQPASSEVRRLGAIEDSADHVGCQPADARKAFEVARGIFADARM